MNNHFFQSGPLLKVLLVIQKYLYQVELPTLISKSEYCWFQRNTNEAETILHNFQIIWKHGAENNNDGPPKHESSQLESSIKLNLKNENA
jgi:hypothetical protein